jgi:hypothetical protein
MIEIDPAIDLNIFNLLFCERKKGTVGSGVANERPLAGVNEHRESETAILLSSLHQKTSGNQLRDLSNAFCGLED